MKKIPKVNERLIFIRRKGERTIKAILKATKYKDGAEITRRLLFDTEKATKICDVVNAFGYTVQTLYLSPGGWIFAENNDGKLEVLDQKTAKDYIGENFPDRYMELFGKVEEA